MRKRTSDCSGGVKKEKQVSTPEPSEEAKKTRITSTTIRSLRSRLGLTQAEVGKLTGVTTHMVYLWENKEGPLNLRDKTREAILAIKGMGAKETRSRLPEGEPKKDRTRTSSVRIKKVI